MAFPAIIFGWILLMAPLALIYLAIKLIKGVTKSLGI